MRTTEMPAQVAFLGTGSMGVPMVKRLVTAGLRVRAWNRTAAKAEALAADGVEVASSPVQAVEGADIIVTMLADAPAVQAAMAGAEGALTAAPGNAVWAQMSTVGPADTARFHEMASRRRLGFVDAPVLGSVEPAEAGALLVLASGASEQVDRCSAVFNAVGNRTLSLGATGAGTRLKVVVNGWLMATAATVADTVRLAETLGVDRDVLVDITRDAGVAGVAAHMQAMFARQFSPTAFPLALARKDAALALASAPDLQLPLFEATETQFSRAVELGHGSDDWSAVVLAGASNGKARRVPVSPAGAGRHDAGLELDDTPELSGGPALARRPTQPVRTHERRQ